MNDLKPHCYNTLSTLLLSAVSVTRAAAAGEVYDIIESLIGFIETPLARNYKEYTIMREIYFSKMNNRTMCCLLSNMRINICDPEIQGPQL